MDELIDQQIYQGRTPGRHTPKGEGGQALSVGTELVGPWRLLRRGGIPLPGTLKETDEVGDAESLTTT